MNDDDVDEAVNDSQVELKKKHSYKTMILLRYLLNTLYLLELVPLTHHPVRKKNSTPFH